MQSSVEKNLQQALVEFDDPAGTLPLRKQSLNYTTPSKAGITLCEVARIIRISIKCAAPIIFMIWPGCGIYNLIPDPLASCIYDATRANIRARALSINQDPWTSVAKTEA